MTRREQQKITDARRQIILNLLREGVFQRTAAHAAGICETTYYRWMERGEEDDAKEPYRSFAMQTREAAAQGELKKYRAVTDAIDGVEEVRETWEGKDGEAVEFGDDGKPYGKPTSITRVTKKDVNSAKWVLARRWAAHWRGRGDVHVEGEITLTPSITLHDGPAPHKEEEDDADET